MLDPAVRDRILKSLNHEEGDRVPVWDFLDNRAIVDHIAPDEPDYQRAMAKVYHTLGIDLCRGWGASFRETDDQAEGAGDARISGRTWWKVVRPIRSLEDLKSYQPQPVSEEWLNGEWLDFNRRMIELLEPYTMFVPGAGCGFHATYDLMGQELFSYAIYDAPADVERILEVQAHNHLEMARAVAKAGLGPIYFIGDDIACKGALMFSPEFLRRTFIPALRRCCEAVKSAGMKVVFHSDGYVMEILDDMLDAGIDGLNPIEPLAGMDIGLLKRRYAKRLVLVGNVDCSQVLPLGTVEDVVEATKECIRQASPGGGHFIGSSSEIVPCTPVENILAFYDACHRYGTYPISI
jgi:uroporphyrinogen decarboxylase